MDTRKLIVTNPDGMTAKGPADCLEEMLLNLCGGGWNANETAEAMRLGQIVRSGGTAEKLQTAGHAATMEWVWPVHDTGWSLDCLGEDCLPMVNRVLDTFNRHVAGGRVKSVTCYMAPRKPETAMSDPGWLEWGVALSDESGKCVLYVTHIQRSIGADVERHT